MQAMGACISMTTSATMSGKNLRSEDPQPIGCDGRSEITINQNWIETPSSKISDFSNS